MTAEHLQALSDLLTTLGEYYTDPSGAPRKLNETQMRVYLQGLARFDLRAVQAAATRHMATSKWFPALADLLELLAPRVDDETAATLAWTTFEGAMRKAGSYRGATFENGAIGETVRQVFGSWAAAGRFDVHSAEWAIRRKTFLSLYPSIAKRHTGAPVTLRGLSQVDRPHVVTAVPGLPPPVLDAPQLVAEAPSHDEALALLKPFREAHARRQQEVADARR